MSLQATPEHVLLLHLLGQFIPTHIRIICRLTNMVDTHGTHMLSVDSLI